jgi:hypothetical protein
VTLQADQRQLEPALRQRIAGEIARNGPIPFSRYMELCLYEPELGYYSRAREQFGKAGDFYTSSDVHAVFGRLLARQFEEMWRALDSPARIDLIELGPGRGLFARDVLDWSAKQFPEFSRALHYALVEQSAHLRTKLQERLAEHIAAGDCEIFDSLESSASRASDNIIVFANEFFDALPVDVIDYRGAVRVGYENGRFTETFVRPPPLKVNFWIAMEFVPKKASASKSRSRRSGGWSASPACSNAVADFWCSSTTATPARSNWPAGIATPS